MGIITDKQMGAKPNGTDQWFTDPAPRGAGRFLGRISPTGERSFYFRYTTSSGQRDTLALGHYQRLGRDGHLSLAGAREKAALWSQLYRGGARDLRAHFAHIEAEQRQASAEARAQAKQKKAAALAALHEADLARQRRLTTRQVFERWAATELAPHTGGDGKRVGRKDGGQYVREQFERRVFATLGDVPLVDVRKADILAILDAVKAQGKMRTANMLLADLKQMFRFAAEREIIDHSPIELIKKRKVGGKDIKRQRVLSIDELAALVAQLPAARLGQRTVLGLWLILATGCRIGELMGAVWSDAQPQHRALQARVLAYNAAQKSGAAHLGFVDLQARTWYLPTTKNQRDHRIHLSAFALEQFTGLAALREADPLTGQPLAWIFPNSRGNGPVCIKSFSKQLTDRQSSTSSRLQNRSKSVDALLLPGGRWSAHDLRRTTSTLMSQLGIPNDVINECLNHIKQGMSGVYIQDRRQAEQIQAFDTLGQRLTALTG